MAKACYALFLIFFVSIFNLTALAQTPPAQGAPAGGVNAPPTYQLDGEASLMSNYILRGLTQTNKDPSLQGAYWFNFGPQFRLGLWGSNLSFPSTPTTHFLLKLAADLKILISNDSNIVINLGDNLHYAANNRDGMNFDINFNMLNYRVLMQIDTNWEGTSSGVNYYAFARVDNVFGNWKWDNQIGYSMLSASGYQNYFDIKSMLGIKPASIYYQAGMTMTSNASQFNNGQGDLFILFAATTKF